MDRFTYKCADGTYNFTRETDMGKEVSDVIDRLGKLEDLLNFIRMAPWDIVVGEINLEMFGLK